MASDHADLDFSLQCCDDVINQCFQTSKKSIDFEVIPRDENNYIFRITYNDGNHQKKVCLYAKTKATIPKIDKIFEDFKKELTQFDAQLTPKFICGKSELLFFEDLTCHKFQTYLEPFDLKHLKQALTVLAEFHAAALAYERLTGENLEEKYNLRRSNFDLTELEDLVEDKDRIEDIYEEVKRRQLSSKFVKTLCHSNLSSNNLLFYYENVEPEQCRVLNFRATLYAPPAYDVLQLLFFTTSEDFRLQNFENTLYIYHNKLKQSLEKYSLNIDDVITIDDLKLSSYFLLPLIKIEAVITQNDPKKKKEATKKLQSIFNFSNLASADCYIIVKNFLKSDDFKLLSFNQPASSELQVKIHHSSEEKTVNFLAKFVDSLKIFQKNFFIHKIFMGKLQSMSFNVLAPCVSSCFFERFEDLLVFEDLKQLNFCPLSEVDLDVNLLSVIVRDLARLHAGTFFLEEKMSEMMKISYRVTDDYEKYLQPEEDLQIIETISEVLALFPEIQIKDIEEMLKKKSSERFRRVISHGNLSVQNIFVNPDNLECRFVDFGTVEYLPPAFDLLTVTYLASSKEDIEERMLEIYHEELGKILAGYNYSVNKVLPYVELVESLTDVRSWVVLNNVFLGHPVDKFSSVLKSGNYDKTKLKEKVTQFCEILKWHKI